MKTILALILIAGVHSMTWAKENYKAIKFSNDNVAWFYAYNEMSSIHCSDGSEWIPMKKNVTEYEQFLGGCSITIMDGYVSFASLSFNGSTLEIRNYLPGHGPSELNQANGYAIADCSPLKATLAEKASDYFSGESIDRFSCTLGDAGDFGQFKAAGKIRIEVKK